MEIDPAYQKVLEWLRPQLAPWRKFTIAIDGVDGSGKSSLARFLSWQLEMPAIETDLALLVSSGSTQPNGDLVKALIGSRHNLNRPVIVEGCFILRTLSQIDIDPDVLIRVETEGHNGSITWRQKFTEYEESFPPAKTADFVLDWKHPSEQR